MRKGDTKKYICRRYILFLAVENAIMPLDKQNIYHKRKRGIRVMAVKMLMKGAVLPGNSTVELKDFEVPTPGYGQVLIQTKATTICGSDIRCIYR
jgi:hypothetical protein